MKPAQWLEVLRYLSLITGIGVTFCAAVLLGWRLGSALGGLWVVPGLLAGIGAGVLTVYSLLKKFLPGE
ncbi:MAG: hypothetical protein GX090_04040 [Firmicutes bacterium]|nr:hypothetical protein [Bacillota bacterium]HPZ91157.1 hypothetical protein [Bacillota bacterium]